MACKTHCFAVLFISFFLLAAGGAKPDLPANSPSIVTQAPVPLPKKYELAYQKLAQQRAPIPCDKPLRSVTRLGDNTIRLESFICMEADFKLFPKIAGDFPKFKLWLLNQINERPGGGSYFIKFLSVENNPADQLALQYKIDIPLFKKERTKHFKVSTQNFPRAFVLSGEGIEDAESLMVSARAEMTAFPAPGNQREVWVYVEGKAKLKSSLLYEALPERVLKSEAGDRVHRILENYQARELTLSQDPK